jgi:hypothetical protein
MGATPAHDHDASADEAFQHAFPSAEQTELLHEDHEAWESVTGLLLTIVTIGVLFFAIIVCVITF